MGAGVQDTVNRGSAQSGLAGNLFDRKAMGHLMCF
jgi:hypothetical protein